MSGEDSKPASKNKSGGKADRQRRLAARLRENLKKRKQKARVSEASENMTNTK